MVSVDTFAVWVAGSLFNVAGVLAASHGWAGARERRYRRLAWAGPAALASAWLHSAFSMGVGLSALPLNGWLVLLAGSMAKDLAAWTAISLAALWLRRRLRRTPRMTESLEQRSGGTAANVDTELRAVVERFLKSADQGSVEDLATIYHAGFACVRIADAGGFVRLTHAQMLAFWSRAGSHSPAGTPSGGVAARETSIQFAEVVGEFGFVLLTRVKDIGNGWEPMFYSLVWQKQDGRWTLLREFVHQRSVPHWGKLVKTRSA